jgi:hypothetical protein
MAALARETGLSVLADAYSDDPTSHNIIVTRVPLDIAVERLAQLFVREPRVVGRVIVLREKDWPIRAHHALPETSWQVPITGVGELKPSKNAEGSPAVYGAVSYISPGNLAARVSGALERSFIVDLPASERRVSLNAYNLTPTDLAAGLEALLNSTASISIRQTDAEVAEEAKLAAELEDRRPPIQKQWEAMKADIDGLMTQKQAAAYKNGEVVEMPFSALPDNLRAEALNYAQALVGINNFGPGVTLKLDAPIEFWLRADNPWAGIHASMCDGTTQVF